MRGVRACGTHARAKQSGASNDCRPRARGGRDQREADVASGGKGGAPRALAGRVRAFRTRLAGNARQARPQTPRAGRTRPKGSGRSARGQGRRAPPAARGMRAGRGRGRGAGSPPRSKETHPNNCGGTGADAPDARSAGRAANTARPKTLKASKLSKVGEKFPPLYLTGDFFRADYQRITQT